MSDFPSDALVLYDATGAAFGFLRFAPREDEPSKGECLFDIVPSGEQAHRSEVRWLAKRHYVHMSEHRFKVDDEDAIRVSKAGFTLVLDPTEDGYEARPPAPPVTAHWS